MLDGCAAKPGAELVDVHLGDMVDDLPDGPFDLVFVAYNTLFNLATADRQAGCFAAVADRLAPGGRFVVEAFVPDDPPRDGAAVTVRSMTADRVVLSVSIHDPARAARRGAVRRAHRTAGTVRLRPWSIRYAPPAELDAMAAAAGLAARAPLVGASAIATSATRRRRHVSVSERRATGVVGPTPCLAYIRCAGRRILVTL